MRQFILLNFFDMKGYFHLNEGEGREKTRKRGGEKAEKEGEEAEAPHDKSPQKRGRSEERLLPERVS
ncbi:MAG: hypothetical protein E6230_25080 [Paenibacillus dendritiformis]|uniref:hypothetical protein n=1 Tax=uncultured Paenibacillus sp. TaxID=227322 RepID=UPI0025E6D423|nr:hypothetical protein [uncultured Paenibacillus sp.]MDU5145450.1 hypothetical protein [Paenibacillus dendritiformis]